MRTKPRLLSNWSRIVLAVLGVTLVAIIGLLAGKHSVPGPAIRFEDVILRSGAFGSARFAPDAATVVYTAAFRFGENGLYVADPNTQVGRILGIPSARLLALSRKAELAILLSPHQIFQYSGNSVVGTLARVPLSGGTPRPVLE